MHLQQLSVRETLPRDLISGLVVALVALPLCLGVALASNAPLFSGIIAGIVGGILVGLISGSHTSVSGPAAGLTAVVAAQIALLGSFDTFLMAVAIAGLIQIGLGLARAGFIAEFIPSCVIKGLLAAIGLILIFKQIPHLLGHDTDPDGEMSYRQPDHETTLSEFGELFELGGLHMGAAIVGLSSMAVLIAWQSIKPLKKSLVPAPLVVVLLSVLATEGLRRLGGNFAIGASHLVQVPVAANLNEAIGLLRLPDFGQLGNFQVYSAAITIALVATLETLLNLEAVDKLDPRQRVSPPSRELIAQGCGNLACGLMGGIPVTSVIIRSSVNISAGGQTKFSAIFHGILLLVCVLTIPQWLNLIPLSALAAVLVVTGFKLASPKLVKQLWNLGWNQFLPFATTVIAIFFTDLLIGVLIGLGVSIVFILHANLRRPIQCQHEHRLQGDIERIELGAHVSFLNRAALAKHLNGYRAGSHVVIDARHTVNIDPDILDLIQDFHEKGGPAHGVDVQLTGFGGRFRLQDDLCDLDTATRDLQRKLSPDEVLKILKDGNERFRSGQRLVRDLHREVQSTSTGQYPLAVVLSCIDSRSPAELIFDLSVGDIFSIRIAGNVVREKVLGSMEYACAVAGSRLVVVMGHTKCGAVTTAVDLFLTGKTAAEVTGCTHIDVLTSDIQRSILIDELPQTAEGLANYVDDVTRTHIQRTVESIPRRSTVLDRLSREGKIKIVGCMYDVTTGEIEFLEADSRVPAIA
jgi:carbonic anhydrase/SulP family sulfate permease